MSLRPAPIGSLLRQEAHKPLKSKRKLPTFNARKHLAAIRACPCVACDADPARVAAHLRWASDGKPEAGMGRKPDDVWVTPLCAKCHTDGPQSQHAIGEFAFWAVIGINPKWLCVELVAVSPDVEAMRKLVFAAREGRK